MNFIMIEGDLINLGSIVLVEPDEKGPGCFVRFDDGGIRVYREHGPECFAAAIVSGNVIYYIGDDHEC